MEHEASLVAKRLRTYFLEAPSNDISSVEPKAEASILDDEISELSGPGFLANCLIVCLTTVAIVLTKITLKLTKAISKLENA